jgi:type VI secretion system protein ImpM
MLRFFKRPGYMGWFGKLPSVGDFAGKGMPFLLKETVHEWMSSGMAALAHSRPDDWQAAYLVSPVWHFIIGPGIWDKPPLVGCLAPSVDKVGRYSPLIVLRSFDKYKIFGVLPPESRWLYRVDTLLRRTIGERIPVDGLDSLLLQLVEAEKSGQNSTANILSDLGIGNAGADSGTQKDWFAWPELPGLFGERNDYSFWWSEPSSVHPLKQIVHCGTPDESLFCSLMDGGVPNE